MKKFWLVLLVGFLLISLVSCNKATPVVETETPSEEITKAPTEEETEVTETTEVVVEEVKPTVGGVLKIAIPTDAASMYVPEMRKTDEHKYALAVYDHLFDVDAEGKPVPLLIESVEEDIANLKYVFKLREGIKFHDGSDFNAEVCKWNLDLYKSEGVQSTAFLKSLVSVEVIDEYTVALNLAYWDSLIPYSLSRQPGWMASKVAFDTYGADYLRTHPVGTGPFKFVSWEREIMMTFERFDDYWQGKPNLDGVEFIIYNTDLVAQAALEAGDVHVIFPTDFLIADDLQEKGYVSINSSIPEYNYAICFKSSDPNSPFYDVRVRQAISYAIDRDEIFEGVFKGHGVAVTMYGVPGGAFYDDEFDGYAYNPEKAKELLKAAGYENGFDTSMIVLNRSTRIDTATIIKEQLARIGVNLNLNIMELAIYATNIDGWTDDMLLHTNLMANGPASQINANFRQNLTAGLGITSFIHPDDLEAAIVEAVSADSKASNDLWKKVQVKIFGEMAMLKAVVTNFSSTVVDPKLHDANIGVIGAATGTLHTAWLEN